VGVILRKLMDIAARQYVAGPGLSDAVGFARTLERDGMSSTIAYWNDSGEDPMRVQKAYLEAIDGVADARTKAYVSVKAPAISMSPTLAAGLAERCAERDMGLHFDSLGLETQAPTFALIDRLRPLGVKLGCTLPGRFHQSIADAEKAIDWELRVRVVKGQWEEPGSRLDPRQGFLEVIDALAGRATQVAVATHDPALAEEALARLAGRGTSAELELLLGLPVHAARSVAERRGVPVRIYVPYGRAWLPYTLSAARKNPRILRWILEDALRGRTLRADRRL